MKIAETPKPNRFFAKDRRGVALITVLTVIALTTILVLTFFSLATSEHRASFTYSHGLQAQQVGEQAVNMVIAQIREATNQASHGNETSPIVWSSQPGAIKVWDESGNEKFAYKLYSDDKMKTENWKEFQGDFQDSQSWSGRPEHFVDLNEPVIRGQKVYYPIVHPAAATEPKWPKPLGDDQDGIEGFSYNEGRNTLRDEGPIGQKASTVAKAGGHLAMPVRWLYQLADGTLGVLADSSSGGGSGPAYRFVAISGNGTPSANNPMAARFAFWADDETTKLNINTHAGGLAWDVPKAGGELDMAMGKHQPAQKEWQRYPGHPATTHLIPALAPGVIDIVNDRDAMEMLFRVVPRIVGGGSESGTRVINTRDPKEMNGLIPDNEPLFPSLDDVIMRADRTPHEFPDAKGRAIPPEQLSEYLERAKFFITVNSRAPETNIFNKPKIAMWPIYNKGDGNPQEYAKYLTPFDQLIHYCASMGKAPPSTGYPRYEYIFKRERADSATFDHDAIPRNKELFAYLRRLLETKIPGYGKSFSDKYGSESTGQLAAMIFDYIRSTNLHDDTLFADFAQAFAKDNTTDFVTFTNPRDFDEKGFGRKAHGQVTPISIKEGSEDYTGMGRFYTLGGADIHVICAGQPGSLADSRYPGVHQYNRGIVERSSGELYTNLPPLPSTVSASEKAGWPQWLRDLEMANPAEFAAAFDPSQWNWQLAFLDEAYRLAVLADPTTNKFNRGALSLPAFSGGETRLQPGERLVQASFLFNLFCPSIGWGSINPDMEIHIERESGMVFVGAEGAVGFLGFEDPPGYSNPDGEDNTFVWATNWAKPHRQGGGRSWGGLLSFGYTLSARQALQENSNQKHVWWQLASKGEILNGGIRSRLTPIDKGYNRLQPGLQAVKGRKVGGDLSKVAQSYRYDLVTVPFKIGEPSLGGAASTPQLEFTGGTVNFKIFNGGEHTEDSARRTTEIDLVQEITIEFDDFKVAAPVIPQQAGSNTGGWMGYINEFNALSHNSNNAVELASLTADPANPESTRETKASYRSGPGTGRRETPPNRAANRGRMAHTVGHWDSGSTFIRVGDVVQSMAIPHGDARIAASMKVITPNDKVFVMHRKYGNAMMAHSLTTSAGGAITGYSPGADKEYLIIPTLPGNNPYRGVIPLAFAKDKSADVQLHGDFDNGAGTMVDGPYINKPDEGNVHSLKTRFTQEVVDYWESRRNYGEFPYFSHPDVAEAGGPAYFSPNRIVSGPGMLGSLPTSLKSSPPKPWQTLLFRPNVVGNDYTTHPGAESPPDHLIMDLFWMPIVEPYAISEPLSTAGKINLNYEIVPFLHVNRDTALRGVFRSEFMLCIPNQWHHSYKHDRGRGQGYHWRDRPYGGALQGKRLRTAIVEAETLKQFQKWFKDGEGAFKSASEICEIHLIPEEVSRRLGQTRGSIGTYTPAVSDDGRVPDMENGKYWRDHSLVGDNSRERPYTNIHNRLTTKSNTFLVHYRAQVIKQARRENEAEYADWRPATDTVQAEYRGSSMVERYVNPNDDLPDFATIEAANIDEYYLFRVINPRRFAP